MRRYLCSCSSSHTYIRYRVHAYARIFGIGYAYRYNQYVYQYTYPVPNIHGQVCPKPWTLNLSGGYPRGGGLRPAACHHTRICGIGCTYLRYWVRILVILVRIPVHVPNTEHTLAGVPLTLDPFRWVSPRRRCSCRCSSPRTYMRYCVHVYAVLGARICGTGCTYLRYRVRILNPGPFFFQVGIPEAEVFVQLLVITYMYAALCARIRSIGCTYMRYWVHVYSVSGTYTQPWTLILPGGHPRGGGVRAAARHHLPP